jgi:hypothetical protein
VRKSQMLVSSITRFGVMPIIPRSLP